MNIGMNMVQDQSIVELEESDSQSASSAGKQKDVLTRKQQNKNSNSPFNEIVPESPMLKQMRGAFQRKATKLLGLGKLNHSKLNQVNPRVVGMAVTQSDKKAEKDLNKKHRHELFQRQLRGTKGEKMR